MTKKWPPFSEWSNELSADASDDVRAAARGSASHPFFPQSADRGASIWRYFSFPAFIDFLARRGLFFSRSDLLGDEWEGAISAGTERSIDELEASAYRLTDPTSAKNLKRNLREMLEAQRYSIFASCWQMEAYDRPDMWDRYCGGPFGVAIKSTFARLDAALPLCFNGHSVLLGEITYGDYDSPDFTVDVLNLLAPFMCKRNQYGGEREIRALMSYSTIDRASAPAGFLVPVLSEKLIERIFVSPKAPGWFLETVVRSCLQFGINTSLSPVEVSRLALPRREVRG